MGTEKEEAYYDGRLTMKIRINEFIENNKWLGDDDRHTDGFRNGVKSILNILRDDFAI